MELRKSQLKDTIAFDLFATESPLHEWVARVLKSNNWQTITIEDTDILMNWKTIARVEGHIISPEGSAAMAAVKKLIQTGQEDKNKSFLILNPSTGRRYIHTLGFVQDRN